MIKRLFLDRFGKFKGKNFEFGPVTLFHGPNEAGKTTVFHALAYTLCGSLRNLPGLDRYGEDCAARGEFDMGGEPFFKHTEFFSMFAVQSDAVKMPTGDGKWLDRIKNGFFSGGMDPELHARDLDKALNARKRKDEEASRQEALSRAEERLVRARAELEDVLAARERAKETGKAHGTAAARTGELAKERDGIAKKSEAMAARARLTEARRTLASLERLRVLAGMKILADEAESARAMRAAAEESRRSCAAAEATERAQAARAGEARLLRQETEIANQAAGRRGGVAREIADKLDPRSSPREVRERKAGAASAISLVLSLAAGASGAAAFLIPGRSAAGAAIAAAFLAAGVLLGAVLFVALRKSSMRTDDAPARAAWDEARAEWARRLPGEEAPAASGPREFLSRLRAIESEAERKASFLDEARAAERRAEDDRARARADADTARSVSARAESDLAAWLQGRASANYEDYLSRIAESKALASEREALKRELAAEASRSGAEGLDGLQAMLRQEIEAIERKWPETSPLPGASRVAEADRLKEAEAALEAAREEERRLSASWERESALAEKDMRSILLELAAAEEALEAARRAVKGDELLRAGETVARDIFRGMARNSDSAFRGLSVAVESFYAPVAGGEGKVRLGSLDEADARVRDSGGDERSPSQLSQGTRDLFYLACRLALASSAGREKAVLVFDEAFKNLDRLRTEKALKMIEDFRNRTGWQIVFLTKDEWLAESVMTVFPRGSVSRYSL
jgi:hypothetical protein